MKSVLLLQAPLGPFFQNLAKQFQKQDYQVIKVHFNGGDATWPVTGLNYSFTEHPNQWKDKCRELILQYCVDLVICYCDCRFYHQAAKKVCQELNVNFLVLEEGYIRSNFITCELDGVNAFSPLYADPSPLWREDRQQQDSELNIKGEFLHIFIFSTRYYLAKSFKNYQYKYYRHHRPWSFLEETCGWLKSGIIKYVYKHRDRTTLKKVFSQKNKKIFLFPLQVSIDSQILIHSEFNSMFHAIDHVLQSFLGHSGNNSLILLKQHPMDRGHINYRSYLKKWQAKSDRIMFVNEMDLQFYYKYLKGVVTINSSVGLSALHHSVPTFCLGKSIYAHKGLVTTGGLDEFWNKQSNVNILKYQVFQQNLKALTQIQGSFYKNQSISIKNLLKRVAKLSP